ncbi:uncharacterized protein LOC124931632 [Impatiens glandulifera]|uniref:uncharacterized protein LOC124931632 n=1 Tax=Impatiens glandulifera TaxID=253017 RepID=UPI001FB06FDC|nr:uncharacterized protein LOC124931632 [Impatiens glandulifera]
MVQRMKRSDIDFRGAVTFSVGVSPKQEIEDSLEDRYGPLNKRSKSSSFSSDQMKMPVNEPSPSQYNPLDEPSPLGLRLRKTPSLLDLIQMRLSQGNVSTPAAAAAPSSQNKASIIKKDVKGANATGSLDKQKASNFPALLLRIGSWEYSSKFEGDLVAKCYFAKNKLVWEILDDGLKSKIEIQWSNILDLKAHCPDKGPGSLTVVLARQPLFFKESNPQPRKHTLWQTTTDFTDGQASSHRQHFLQFSTGVLNKHYEKLIKYDAQLDLLSRKLDIIIESPLFEKQTSCAVVSLDGSDTSSIQKTEATEDSSSSCLHDTASGSTESLSFKTDEPNSSGIVVSAENYSPILGNATQGQQQDSSAVDVSDWDKLKGIGVHRSMSITDLVNHIGHKISEKRVSSGNPMDSKKEVECDNILENLTQILMSDTHSIAPSDEKTLMSRINSFCCLLDDDPPNVPKPQEQATQQLEGGLPTDVAENKQAPGMSRRDSYGDLVFNLPRISSLPKFLFNIFESDDEDNSLW